MKVKVKLARCKMVYCEKVDGCWQTTEHEFEIPKMKLRILGRPSKPLDVSSSNSKRLARRLNCVKCLLQRFLTMQ